MAEVQTLSSVVLTTWLGVFELENAIRLSVFRKIYSAADASAYLAAFDADFRAGRVQIAGASLQDITEEARRLSAAYTIPGGYRSFDVIHVAGCLRAGATRFLSFDKSQRKLAEAEGLNVGPISVQPHGPPQP